MQTDFEPVMEALFAALQAQLGASFPTMSRRTKLWTDQAEQPALYLRRIGTTDEYKGHQLSQTTLECELWIYSKAGADPNAIPDATLATLDTAVRAALAPDEPDEQRYTIGGLVYWCRIEGRSHYSPGDLGGQGISMLPVRITLP